MLKLGYNVLTETPILVDINKTGHVCIVGGTNSGKSVTTLYLLYNLLNNYAAVKLFICDFKKSGDYKGISDNFSEFEEVTKCIDDFYEEFENTPENNPQIKIC